MVVYYPSSPRMSEGDDELALVLSIRITETPGKLYSSLGLVLVQEAWRPRGYCLYPLPGSSGRALSTSMVMFIKAWLTLPLIR